MRSTRTGKQSLCVTGYQTAHRRPPAAVSPGYRRPTPLQQSRVEVEPPESRIITAILMLKPEPVSVVEERTRNAGTRTFSAQEEHARPVECLVTVKTVHA